MTRDLCHLYFREFQHDPALFADKTKFHPYIYDPAQCDAYFDRYVQLGRIHWAVMLEDEPIGEVILKNIDRAAKCCTLGICMKNDRFKGKGFGTAAEILALEYAFTELEMEIVYADALLDNTRSRHVLTKVGFTETHRDETFQYYACSQNTWKRPEPASPNSI